MQGLALLLGHPLDMCDLLPDGVHRPAFALDTPRHLVQIVPQQCDLLLQAIHGIVRCADILRQAVADLIRTVDHTHHALTILLHLDRQHLHRSACLVNRLLLVLLDASELSLRLEDPLRGAVKLPAADAVRLLLFLPHLLLPPLYRNDIRLHRVKPTSDLGEGLRRARLNDMRRIHASSEPLIYRLGHNRHGVADAHPQQLLRQRHNRGA
mmetsp:Transcript_28993/g.72833  ORF Transcript_28993/g.72833 Transcript_28993/m.72833 type:complete len:210 (-) Transcript_28993:60-689(-)